MTTPTKTLEQSSELLMEKIVDPDNLESAWKKVRSNHGAPRPRRDYDRRFSGTLPSTLARDQPTTSRWHLRSRPCPAEVHRQTRWRSAKSRHSKRDRASDSASHLTNPDSNLRSGLFRIELWISTETIRSGRSQTGAALYQTRLSPMYRYGPCEILRQSSTRCFNGQSRTESA